MGIRRGRIELFRDDQLMVALPDLKIIAGPLERFGIRPGLVDERTGRGTRPNDPRREPALAGGPDA